MQIKHIDLTHAETLWNSCYGQHSHSAPFYTHAWHSLWFSVFGNHYEPLYLSLDERIIAPFVKKDNTLYFSGGKEIADYLDIIGSDKKKPQAWEYILHYAKTHGITKCKLYNIPKHSSTYSFFKSLHPKSSCISLNNITIQTEDTTPIVSLPSSWEKYTQLLEKKYRHELKRKIRKFKKDYPNVSFHISSNPKNDIHKLITLMKQNDMKDQFLSDSMTAFFTQLPVQFASSVLLFFLKDKDQTIAAKLAFVENSELMLYNSGYDAEYYGAGFYTAAKSIEYAINQGYAHYNFLQGNERYKYELGGNDSFVYTIKIR